MSPKAKNKIARSVTGEHADKRNCKLCFYESGTFARVHRNDDHSMIYEAVVIEVGNAPLTRKQVLAQIF